MKKIISLLLSVLLVISPSLTLQAREIQSLEINEQIEAQPLQSREWIAITQSFVGHINPAGMTWAFNDFVNGQWHTGTLTVADAAHVTIGVSRYTIVVFAGWVTGTGWFSSPIDFYSKPIEDAE